MNYLPVKLTSCVKGYLWGGRRLITDFNKKTDLEKAAESWELSTHKDGESVVASGEFAGHALTAYIAKNGGNECIGSKASTFDFFPILIKLIDAKDNLSIQVHPDDEYALRVEGEYGKTEMWYIVDCEEDSFLYYGVNRDITKEEFERRILDNTLLEVLNKVPVKRGDVFFIPAGTIHAICSGILICEIQQNSNTTYRIYDYDRRDKDGNPRELHVEKAQAVSKLTPSPEQKKYDGNVLADCKYFTVEKVDCNGEEKVTLTDESFRSLVILSGNGEIQLGKEKMAFTKGDSIFIPAQNNEMKLCGNFEAVLSYV
ncbi:MAG: class I mannose-6-phosphate isomerase [Ruminococcaceae bacterium]|nr:class I mannose-6-phosphate isomerase [Oscillospiraceae bacterium]